MNTRSYQLPAISVGREFSENKKRRAVMNRPALAVWPYVVSGFSRTVGTL